MPVSSGGKTIGILLTYKHAPFLEDLYRSIPKDVFDAIIISDDNSGDGIEVIAARLGIPCFSHPRLGYGGNIKYGCRKAMDMGADYMVEIHGDGQYDLSASKPAIEKAKQGYDLVMGSRFMDLKQPLEDHMSFARYFANIGLSTLARIVLRSKLTEFHNGFRVYTRRLFETVAMDASSNDFLFGFQVIAQARFCDMKIAEVPNRCYYFNEHTSISIPKSIQYAFQMIGVLFLYCLAKAGVRTALFSTKCVAAGHRD